MYQRLAESPACFICGWEVGLERYFPPYVVSERIFCIESILLFVPGVSMNLVFFFMILMHMMRLPNCFVVVEFFYERPVTEEKH